MTAITGNTYPVKDALTGSEASNGIPTRKHGWCRKDKAAAARALVAKGS